jgi:tetratricopeptide (TPR) repeat protein
LFAADFDWESVNREIVSLSSQGKTGKAVALAESRLREARKQFSDRLPEQSVPLLINLGVLYKRIRKPGEAESVLTEALEIAERLGGENGKALQPKILSSLGSVYASSGDLARSRETYEKALDLKQEIVGADHPDVAVILDRLAGVCQFQNQFDQAEEYLTRALEIRKKKIGSEDQRTAALYFNLGELYLAQNRYEDALPQFLSALNAFEKHGENNPQLIYPLQKLAWIKKQQGKNLEAESFYRQALQVVDRNEAFVNRIETVSLITNLASLYLMRDKSEVEELLLRALDITENKSGPHLAARETILSYLGDYYRKTGQQKKLRDVEKQLRKIR